MFHTGPLAATALYNKLSLVLLNLNKYITSYFFIKSRKIHKISRWKITEFRLFLLYTGPIILKNNINNECYNNFLVLNMAILFALALIIVIFPHRKKILK